MVSRYERLHGKRTSKSTRIIRMKVRIAKREARLCQAAIREE